MLLVAGRTRAAGRAARRWVLAAVRAVRARSTSRFLVANGVKFLDGAWFPVVLGIVVFTLLRTWRRGRELLHAEIRKDGIQLDTFLPGLMLAPPVRVPGTAVFLTAQTGVVPQALLHNLKHNKVLHERNVLLTVETLNVPYAPKDKRLKIEPIGDDFYRVTDPLRLHGDAGRAAGADALAATRAASTSTRWTPRISPAARPSSPAATAACRSGATSCSRFMHRNAAPATGFFRIPGNRLVELGAQVEI